MSKDARNEDLDLSPAAREQFDQLVALLSKVGFGEDGPPLEITFAEIERFGHRAGRMLARALDAKVAEQHAAHFADQEPCPACGQQHPRKESPHELPLMTDDGEVKLPEPAYRCTMCQRDFFPSTPASAD